MGNEKEDMSNDMSSAFSSNYALSTKPERKQEVHTYIFLCMKLGENGKKAKDVAYVCIYTTGEEIEWRDEIDRTLGRFTYWGDNRKAGGFCRFGGVERVFKHNGLMRGGL